jgi:hypothetical protein
MNRQRVNSGRVLWERKYRRRGAARANRERLEIVEQRFYDAEIDRWVNEGGALCPAATGREGSLSRDDVPNGIVSVKKAYQLVHGS